MGNYFIIFFKRKQLLINISVRMVGSCIYVASIGVV